MKKTNVIEQNKKTENCFPKELNVTEMHKVRGGGREWEEEAEPDTFG